MKWSYMSALPACLLAAPHLLGAGLSLRIPSMDEGSSLSGAAHETREVAPSGGLRLDADVSDVQPVNPATRTDEQPSDTGRVRTYELPAITVPGEPVSSLREEDRVGTYGQPRWTATRRFPNTRVYVIPEGKIEVEYWYRSTFERDDTQPARQLGEIEVGLPYRFQLDVYFRADQEDWDQQPLYGQQVELRWALADWGKIWGNPTLYLEYINLEERADKIEAKLLLGGEIAEGWHWGANAVGEFEIDGPEWEREYQLTGGVSYTVLDSKFSVGAETKMQWADVQGDRGNFSDEYYLGPSLQWKPLKPMTVNFAPLLGITGDSPYAQITLNVGWEF